MDSVNTWGYSFLPRDTGGDYLYLDFDGVLHHEDVHIKRVVTQRQGIKRHLYFGEKAWSDLDDNKLLQHAQLLEQLLLPYPNVKIILSTSWVRVLGYSKARKKLPYGLRKRVVGSTFHSKTRQIEFLQDSRGMQIWGDVQRRKPRAWVAIDDDVFGWPKWSLGNLVDSNEIDGISDHLVQEKLIEKLKENFVAKEQH